MRAFASANPQVKVQLHSGQTMVLKERFARGALDVILTTEAERRRRRRDAAPASRWSGSERTGAGRGSGVRCRSAPSPAASSTEPAIETLNAAGFDWKLELDSVTNPAMDASIRPTSWCACRCRARCRPSSRSSSTTAPCRRCRTFCVNMYVTQGPRRRLAEPLAAAVPRRLRRAGRHRRGVAAGPPARRRARGRIEALRFSLATVRLTRSGSSASDRPRSSIGPPAD